MIPELGNVLLVMANSLTVVLLLVWLTGFVPKTNSHIWLTTLAKPITLAVFATTLLAFLCLAYSFLQNDFTVNYVANNSSQNLPTLFKISAVWGGHEGSLVLWLLLLSSWAGGVQLFSSAPTKVKVQLAVILAVVFIAFSSFTLLTSNPFDRVIFNPPTEGKDLNPLLQDIGLAFHPPLLYVGYVGFSVSFAFAIAGLWQGNFDQHWAKWMRPWTNMAWAFLGLGIALGSWWAYYELGWGGYWFWDPVENASLMPWLLGGALVHSLIVLEKRGIFSKWVSLLAISTFSLSILGAFLVRSGILDSVHAFSSSPERGRFLLILLFSLLVFSVLLYSFRAAKIGIAHGVRWQNKEILLLINNLLLVAACFTVLLGTLYPIVIDLLGGGRISVGPPYFEAIFKPLVVVMAVAGSVALISRWGKSDKALNLLRRYAYLALFSAGLATLLVLTILPYFSLGGWFALWLASSLIASAAWSIISSGFLQSSWAALLGHTGLALLLAGASLNTIYSTEQNVRLSADQSVEISGLTFQLKDYREFAQDNYVSRQAKIAVSKNGQPLMEMLPEKRLYAIRSQLMTEAAIEPGALQDVFVVLGEKFHDGSLSFTIQMKAFIRWIWLGVILISLGTMLAIKWRRT